MVIEVGKVFFIGRVPNLDNVVLSSLGALVGVLLIPPLSATPFAPATCQADPADTNICIIAYAEFSPFYWIRSRRPDLDTDCKDRMASVQLLLFCRAASGTFRPSKKIVFVGFPRLSYRRGQPRCKPTKTTSSRHGGGLVGGSNSRSRTDWPAVTESLVDRCLAVWRRRLGGRCGIRALSTNTGRPRLI